ncbi:germination protease precursor [Clostridium tepidiprofundi DSM 19306]|uniref:Germination protease n=1 Tax=Clostridium tepidiprofundi DSM 19306 TaxID=1121338 RepID=A0A151B3L8_9CLOT|nr:GPR endopeptidase [Clostridium tepidiprofundi]KYH34514.1 germination protease precursor [Clostridium tepidiprofundi DSM 19306]
MINIRTDLAVEAQEMYKKQTKQNIPGTKISEYMDEDIKVTIVSIIDEKGEEIIGKPKGTYITLEIPEFVHYDQESMNRVSQVIAKNLSPLIKLEDSMTALVVGLGNWKVTPDAVGPKVVSKIMVTRHLKQLVPDSIDEEVRPVCAIAPGVLGITGMETREIIKGIVEKTKPNLVICVDALASRRLERVNKTIQISNTGISPGSGVGNRRMEISERTLGIPVIAIGVPTVVDAATMANDTIDLVLDEMIKLSNKGGEFYNILKSVDKNEKHRLIKEVLDPYVGDLMVTPKEVDMIIDSVSKIIANGVNIALQPALDLEDIGKYIN